MSNKPSTPNHSPTLAREFKMLTPPLKSRRLSSPVRLGGPNTRSSPHRRSNILSSPDRPPPNDTVRTPLNRVTRSSIDMTTVTRSADRLSHLLNTPEPVAASPVFQPTSLKRSRSRSRSHPGSRSNLASGSPSDSSPNKLPAISARKIMSPSKSLAYPRLPTTPRILLFPSPNARSQLSTPAFESNRTPRRIFKAPQFLSPAKRSYDETSHSSEGVSEISFKLKNKLSLALDKLNKASLKAPDLRFDPFSLSPTSTNDRPSRLTHHNVPRYDPAAERAPSPTLLKGANFNLQTQEQSHTSPVVSPIWEQNYARKVASPESPSSAHDALIAALRRNRRSQSSPPSSKSPNTNSTSPPAKLTSTVPGQSPTKEASHMASNASRPRPSLGPSLDTNSGEKDAVLSLMSLSSPCKRRRDSSPTRNSFSRASSSSSSALAGPSPTRSQHKQDSAGSDITVDDDETDIEPLSDSLQ